MPSLRTSLLCHHLSSLECARHSFHSACLAWFPLAAGGDHRGREDPRARCQVPRLRQGGAPRADHAQDRHRRRRVDRGAVHDQGRGAGKPTRRPPVVPSSAQPDSRSPERSPPSPDDASRHHSASPPGSPLHPDTIRPLHLTRFAPNETVICGGAGARRARKGDLLAPLRPDGQEDQRREPRPAVGARHRHPRHLRLREAQDQLVRAGGPPPLPRP